MGIGRPEHTWSKDSETSCSCCSLPTSASDAAKPACVVTVTHDRRSPQQLHVRLLPFAGNPAQRAAECCSSNLQLGTLGARIGQLNLSTFPRHVGDPHLSLEVLQLPQQLRFFGFGT